MTKKLIIAILLIIAVQNAILSSDIAIKTTPEIVNNLVDTATKPAANLVDTISTVIRPSLILTEDGDVYYGSAEINIDNGDKKKIEFYGTFVAYQTNCTYAKCYSGWIDNYTITGENTVIGFKNQTLDPKPVFDFKANSQTDFVITRNPNLAEAWTQIIEILCQKINPLLTQEKPASAKLSTQARASAQTFEEPAYDFKTISASDLTGIRALSFNSLNLGNSSLKLAIGDKLSSSSQDIALDGLKAPTSLFSESLVLSNQNVIKSRTIDYQLKLDSSGLSNDQGIQAGGFSGLISLNFKFAQKIKTPVSNAQSVKNLLVGKNSSPFNLKSIEDRRANLGQILDPSIKLLVDEGPTFEDAQIGEVDEVAAGESAIRQLNLDTSQISSLDTTFNVRNLQGALTQNSTVYNYKKVLISKSIFGKTFEANVEVKCYLLIYTFDHQLQCIGTFNYQLFGNTKSVTIFNFQKSVFINWSWDKQYNGNWGFSVWVGLPSPVNFIGITFNFNVAYAIGIHIDVTSAVGTGTYTIKVNSLATTKVTTSASAGVKVIAIEGGVYISGTLVDAGTDPKISLTYYFNQKYIKILAQWYFWLNALNYKWGFYYKTWSFWSGWSGKKIIKEWTINGVYGKWAILNKSWYVYL